MCHATVDPITSLKPDYNMLPQNNPELLCCIAGVYGLDINLGEVDI